MADAADPGAGFSGSRDRRRCCGVPMVTVRFGRKIKLPSTVQIKHQLLVRWLADQTAKEAAEAASKKLDTRPKTA
jgi:hypothetical protein